MHPDDPGDNRVFANVGEHTSDGATKTFFQYTRVATVRTPFGPGLRAGDRVRVRTLEEVLATLDSNARLDGLPFMPEMANCGGKEFTVLKRVEKINDLADRSGLRRMKDAVILDGVRCDGTFHGGCQALCQSIWKETWLVRVDDGAAGEPRSKTSSTSGTTAKQIGAAGGIQEDLLRACRGPESGNEETFSCQMTELKNASSYLAWWDVRQYVRDLRSGNASLGEIVRAFAYWILTLIASHVGGTRLLVGAYNRVQKLRGGDPYPRNGTLQKTPTEKLHLKPGELVQVKSYDEILETLDTRNKNRGLWFDVEMVKYCNGVYRVLCRVERIVHPKSGRMLTFDTDCIVLEGVTTRGEYHRFYPQNEYPFWREIWLRRYVPTPGEPVPRTK